jgi:hypothetical protein
MANKHNFITADASCDLANMLALKNSRSVLFNSFCSDLKTRTDNQKSNTLNENNTLQSILGIFGHIPSSKCGSYIPPLYVSHFHWESKEIGHLIDWEDVVSTTTKNQNTSVGIPRTKSARNSFRSEKASSEDRAVGHDSIVTDALALAAFFVSLDCTVEKGSSKKFSLSSAIAFKQKLLQNKQFICGISKLLLADTVVTCILESKRPECRKNSSAEKDVPNPVHVVDSNDGKFDIYKENVLDPTSRGRKKKRRKIYSSVPSNLDSIQEETSLGQELDMDSVQSFNFFQDDTEKIREERNPTSRLREKLIKVYTEYCRDKVTCDESKAEHISSCPCANELSNESCWNPGKLALDTLQRILTEKCSDQEDESNEYEAINQCDDDVDEENDFSQDEVKVGLQDIVEKSNLNNPMIFKNVMIRRSGAIPYLIRTVTETFEACLASMLFSSSNETECCPGCFHYLKDRVIQLSTLIDGLCCMSKKNREIMCLLGRKDNDQTFPLLIPSLLKTAAYFSASLGHQHDSILTDVGLASLRTLTSLTHENDVASSQISILSMTMKDLNCTKNHMETNGVEIILNLLYNLVEIQSITTPRNHASVYDGIIFCFNALTNLLESASFDAVSKMILRTVVARNNKHDETFGALAWISRWVVDQTEPFRDAVMSGTFGKSDKEENMRDLKHHEDEFLITAGNGFIFLACLLGTHRPPDCYLSESSQQIQNIIFDSVSEGQNISVLMINTLKAFCNYYRYSVGDLSVAIITPVLNLISGLERMGEHIK